MRYLPSDKYTIAWFKLSECVARGERERAFGLHRLLAHSFDDAAFATQLEGDIFLAFEDTVHALIKYRDSMELYKSTGRFLEAVAIGEHILLLSAEKEETLEIVIELYALLNFKTKQISHLYALCALLIAKDQLEKAHKIIKKLSTLVEPKSIQAQRQQLIFAQSKKSLIPTNECKEHLEELINQLIDSHDAHALSLFIMHLKSLNEMYYGYAQEIMSRC